MNRKAISDALWCLADMLTSCEHGRTAENAIRDAAHGIWIGWSGGEREAKRKIEQAAASYRYRPEGYRVFDAEAALDLALETLNAARVS